jgi:hypothetical protein
MKKKTSTIVAIVVFILVLVGIYAVKQIFLADESSAIYGTRLEGKSDVEISTSTKNKVKEKLKDGTTDSSIRIAGRIIEITFTVNDDTSLEKAKELGKSTLEVFSSAEKEYYDIQIFIENDANTSQFPIIGYKHHTKDDITWTKDRSES